MMAASVAERPLFIKLNLPDGLEEALEGLAREVLREKPGNIYEFAADYFEELVKKRNEGIRYFPLSFASVIFKSFWLCTKLQPIGCVA